MKSYFPFFLTVFLLFSVYMFSCRTEKRVGKILLQQDIEFKRRTTLRAFNNLSLNTIKELYLRDNGIFRLRYDSIDKYAMNKQLDYYKIKYNYLTVVHDLNPAIKDSVNIMFRFEHSSPMSDIDSVDIYMSEKMFISGKYPSRMNYAAELTHLEPHPIADFINIKRDSSAKICLVSHDQKIYFDTIVPLRYRGIDIIRLGNGFQFRFWGIN